MSEVKIMDSCSNRRDGGVEITQNKYLGFVCVWPEWNDEIVSVKKCSASERNTHVLWSFHVRNMRQFLIFKPGDNSKTLFNATRTSARSEMSFAFKVMAARFKNFSSVVR